MILTSPAFQDGAAIPRRHTCDGEDLSPPLAWGNLPAATASLALIVDDPDAPAGLWTHWVVWNLPVPSAGLPEGLGPGPLPGGGTQGRNSWGEARWQGPCPPGDTHRYRFRLHALDVALTLPASATAPDVERAMQGRVLDESVLVGAYTRSR